MRVEHASEATSTVQKHFSVENSKDLYLHLLFNETRLLSCFLVKLIRCFVTRSMKNKLRKKEEKGRLKTGCLAVELDCLPSYHAKCSSQEVEIDTVIN